MAARRKPPDWLTIETEYRAGVLSLNAISAKHRVPESTIRSRAKVKGWARDPEGVMRSMVAAKVSGLDELKNKDPKIGAREAIKRAADAAGEDMLLAVGNARIALRKVMDLMSDQQVFARDLSILVDTNSKAMETIRRILGLDAATDEQHGGVVINIKHYDFDD